MASVYGSSCANNGKGALDTPEIDHQDLIYHQAISSFSRGFSSRTNSLRTSHARGYYSRKRYGRLGGPVLTKLAGLLQWIVNEVTYQLLETLLDRIFHKLHAAEHSCKYTETKE
eukprot:1178511-Prorocentrum_minimum.AAC.1